MHIQFDEKAIHVQILVGALETYTPDRKAKIISDKVAKLRQDMDDFISEIVKPEIDLIKNMVEEANKKQLEKLEGTTSNSEEQS